MMRFSYGTCAGVLHSLFLIGTLYWIGVWFRENQKTDTIITHVLKEIRLQRLQILPNCSARSK